MICSRILAPLFHEIQDLGQLSAWLNSEYSGVACCCGHSLGAA